MDPTPSVAFIATHPNAANHFLDFTDHLLDIGIDCSIYTDKANARKFDALKIRIHVINPDTDLADLAESVALHSSVVVGCGNPGHAKLFTKLKDDNATTRRWVYHDNQEDRVPEPYPATFAAIAAVSDGVLYAARRHPERGVFSSSGEKIPVPARQIGLGYYPLKEALAIQTFIKEEVSCIVARDELFHSNGIEETGQDIFVYLGGANDRYMTDFSFFLALLPNTDISNTVIVLQRHPRAEERGIKDGDAIQELEATGNLPLGCSCIVSNNSCTTQILGLANGVIYAQTGMAAQCVFGEVPQVFKVTAEKDPDCLVKAGFLSPTTPEDLTRAFKSKDSGAKRAALVEVLDLDPKCLENLLPLVFSIADQTQAAPATPAQ